jgi:hypothetical protein
MALHQKSIALKITNDNVISREIITWKEPPIFQWKDSRNSKIIRQRDGVARRIERSLWDPIATDLRLKKS